MTGARVRFDVACILGAVVLAIGLSLDTLMGQLQANLDETVARLNLSRKWTDELGLALIAHEAGQHLVAYNKGANQAAIDELFDRANRDPRMGKLYEKYHQAWRKQGGGLMAFFSSISHCSKHGRWGMFELEGQPLREAPKAEAILKLAQDLNR